jgi:hypothetical protein
LKSAKEGVMRDSESVSVEFEGEHVPVVKRRSQEDPFAAFIRVVKQAGINNSKQGNGDKAETNQITSKGSGQAERIRVQ